MARKNNYNPVNPNQAIDLSQPASLTDEEKVTLELADKKEAMLNLSMMIMSSSLQGGAFDVALNNPDNFLHKVFSLSEKYLEKKTNWNEENQPDMQILMGAIAKLRGSQRGRM